jgi:hypothetical protein
MLHRFRASLACVLACSALAACADIKVFETDAQGGVGRETGFLYYEPKIYLAIEQSKEGRTAKLLSLPDLTRPRLIQYQSGFGSTTLEFSTQNGLLTSVNQSIDTKVPELLTSVAGLATAVGAFLVDPAAPAERVLEPLEQAALQLHKAVLKPLEPETDPVVVDNRTKIGEAQQGIAALAHVTPTGQTQVLALLDERKRAAKLHLAKLNQAREALDNLAAKLSPYSDLRARLIDPLFQLRLVTDRLQSWTAPEPEFVLYELVAKDNQLRFLRVELR